jgi:hypothetical protein
MFQNDGSWSLSKKQTTTSLVAEVSVFVTLDDMYVSENTGSNAGLGASNHSPKYERQED